MTENRLWWDAAMVAVCVIVAGVAALDNPVGLAQFGAWAIPTMLLVGWLAIGRWCIAAPPTWRNRVFSLFLIAVVLVGLTFAPEFAIVQAVAYPLQWMLARTQREAVLGNVLTGLAVAVGSVLRSGVDGIIPGLAIGLLSAGFAIWLGLWITKIAEFGEERARLLSELQAAQGQLAVMHRDTGVESERARLSREIHDTIAQSLTGLVMVAQRAGNRLENVPGDAVADARADAALIEAMARDALVEARGLVAATAPVAVDSTLAEALGRLAATFERETGVRVVVDVAQVAIDRELEVVLLRCAQEGLANVRKHAQAGAASVTVVIDDEVATLTVRDDGVGPTAAEAGARTEAGATAGGFGLSGMSDRVGLVGGSVAIVAPDDGGTALIVTVPLGDREALET